MYSDTVLKLIHSYKYKNRTCLARPFALLLYQEFVRHFGQDGIDAVLPVPLHPRRLRNRGYNQAMLIIRQWPQIKSQLGHQQNLQIFANDKLLARNKHTRPQTGLDRKARARNIRGAFIVENPRLVEGMHLLIVDDVYTTGSTVNECARVLCKAGAAGVSVLTLARTP